MTEKVENGGVIEFKNFSITPTGLNFDYLKYLHTKIIQIENVNLIGGFSGDRFTPEFTVKLNSTGCRVLR